MPETPPSGRAPGPSPPGPSAAPVAAPTWPPPPPMAAQKARWLPFLTLAIALAGLGVGIGAWLRPMPDARPAAAATEPTYTDEQIATAKANVCEAYRIVDRSVVTNTHRTNPVPGDEIGALATGAYGVLALYQGGDYLLDRISAEPATPVELANPVKTLAETLRKFGMIVLAGEPEAARDVLRQDVDADSEMIEGLCR